MVVASAVLPTLLATQTALQDANVETDVRFGNGASAIARPAGGGFAVFGIADVENPRMDEETFQALRAQPGVASAVGLAEDFRSEVSDRVQLRTAQAGFVGVRGDLNTVVFGEFIQWAQGDGSASNAWPPTPTP